MATPESRIYVGRLDEGRPAVFAVDGDTATRLGPEGEEFAWGADAGEGIHVLARALITDASGSAPPPDVCWRFAAQVLSRLPHDGFALQRETVNAWLRRVVPV